MKNLPVILKKNIYVKTLISLVLSLLMSIGHAYTHEKLFGLVYILLFCVRTMVIYIVLSLIYYCFDAFTTDVAKIHLSKIFFLSLFLLILFYFISYLALYPGIFAYDAPTQVQMYFYDSISEWHPVLHTVFLGKIIEIAYSLGFGLIGGVALYTIVQFVIISLCFSYLLVFIYKKTGNLKVWIISTIFLGIFPTISLQVLSATKDSFFMGFFVLSMTLSIEFLLDQSVFFTKPYKIILWILSTLLMVINRNNCIYAFPILMIAMISVCNQRKKALFLMSIVIVLFAIYKSVFVPHYVSVSVDGREKLSIPAQQLARIYLDEDANLTSEEKDIIENLIIDNLIDRFGFELVVLTTADPVKACLNMDYYDENRSLIRKCYFDVILHNPQMAIESFIDITCGFWYPVYDLTLYGQGYKGYWVVNSFEPYYIDSKIPVLLRYYKFFETTDFSNVLLLPVYLIFAPALFFYIFILMFGHALLKKNKPFIAIYAFILVFWSTYLLGPMALVRYTTYLYAILPLYFVQVFGDFDNQKTT